MTTLSFWLDCCVRNFLIIDLPKRNSVFNSGDSDKSTEMSFACVNDKMNIAACDPEVQHCRQVTDLLTPTSYLNQLFVKLPLAPLSSRVRTSNFGDLSFNVPIPVAVQSKA